MDDQVIGKGEERGKPAQFLRPPAPLPLPTQLNISESGLELTLIVQAGKLSPLSTKQFVFI